MIVIMAERSAAHTVNGVSAGDWLFDENAQAKILPEGVKYVLDENSVLGKKMLACNLRFDIVEENGQLIDVTPKEMQGTDLSVLNFKL